MRRKKLISNKVFSCLYSLGITVAQNDEAHSVELAEHHSTEVGARSTCITTEQALATTNLTTPNS